MDKEIKDLKEQTVKLYYLYEKFYNTLYKYAWISYSEINKYTGYNNTYIKHINNNLRKNKLLEIELGKWYEGEDGINIRERNKYIPMTRRRKGKKKGVPSD